MKTVYLVLILSTTSLLRTNAQVEFNIQVNRLSEKVALLSGGLWSTNVLVVKSQKGLIMIDAPFSHEATMCYKKAAITEFGSDDFIYLINSHSHLCHLGGNSVFKNASIIGHENLKSDIIESKHVDSNELSFNSILAFCSESIEYLNNSIESIPNEEHVPDWMTSSKKHFEDLHIEYSKGVDIAIPDITFDSVYTLDLGDLTVKLVYYGYAHSSSDIVIHIPEEKILFTGGIIYKGQVPLTEIDKNTPADIIKNWLSILEFYKSDSVELKYIIPSHGGMNSVYDKQLLVTSYNYFEKLWNQVVVMKNNENSLDETKEKLNFNDHFSEFGGLTNKVYEGTVWEVSDIHSKNIEGIWNLIAE